VSTDNYALLNEARSGSRGKDQARIAEEGLAFVAMLLRKNHDYGSSAWQRPTLAPEMDVDAAIRVRMSDKIARISRLMTQVAEVEDEKLEDTIRDLGAYCLLWLARPKGRLMTEGGEG